MGNENDGPPGDAKKTTLLGEGNQSKDFFWDQAITLLASGMLALTALEVLSSIRGQAVQCLTPQNYTVNQGAFINSYCTQFTRRADFFFFVLVIQAILVFGPQFLWSSIYFGKFRYFFALAHTLDRHRDSNTGDFDPKNFVVVRALKETFGSTRWMYITYLVKLVAQVVVAVAFIITCATVFNEYNPAFDCPSNDSLYLINGSWPLDEQITCVLSSLNLLVAVWWANFALLGGVVVVSVYGLVWCVVFNHQHELNWDHVASFSLNSGIQTTFYRPKPWKERCLSARYRIFNNLDLLFLRLYRDDTGRACVLREVLIAEKIEREEQRILERQIYLHNMGSEGKHEYTIQEDGRRAEPNVDLGNTLESVLCNFLTCSTLGLSHIKAVDICFGSSGFKMMIATMRDEEFYEMVSVNFDPHYLNQDQPFEANNFRSVVHSIRTWSTIFSKKKELVAQLRIEMAKKYFHLRSWQRNEEKLQQLLDKRKTPSHERANVVLVGPIPKEDSQKDESQKEKPQKVIAVHWLLRMMLVKQLFVKETFYLVVVRPLTVNGVCVTFEEFNPNEEETMQSEMVKFTECAYFNPINQEGLSANYNTFTDGKPYSRKGVAVKCGSSHCTFDIKVYKGILKERITPV